MRHMEQQNNIITSIHYPFKAVESIEGTPAFFATKRKKLTTFLTSLQRQKVVRYLFSVLVALSIINTTIMTIHLFDKEYNYPVFKHSFISAIYPNQNINQTLQTSVITIKKFHEDTVKHGDQVVVKGDFGIEEYWVETIVGINSTTKQLIISYDQLSTKKVLFDDVYGVYQKESNVLGTLYYSAKQKEGYLLLVASTILILGTYYFAFIGEYIFPKSE